MISFQTVKVCGNRSSLAAMSPAVKCPFVGIDCIIENAGSLAEKILGVEKRPLHRRASSVYLTLVLEF
jgi:hypothetical protein